jgi:thiamine-monophosphate kinase
MAEHDLIAAFRELVSVRGDRVLRGSGDDAAVVRADGVAVTSIDSVVDGVHFERATHSLADIGHKALARGLSDLAGMGAEPGEAYVALMAPEGLDHGDAVELVAGMEALARETGTTIAGGDVTSGPVLAIAVSVTGWVGSESELAYRSGARPGDLLGVTGALGAAAAGLLLLRPSCPTGPVAPSGRTVEDELIRRHRRPQPRLAEGRALAKAGVSSMIDVSDGVATDAAHLAEASDVKIELRLDALPVAAGVEAVTDDPLRLAATGGDDYELLFTAAPERREAIEKAAKVRWLGRVEPGSGLVIVGPGGEIVDLSGFEHGV